MLIVYIVYLQLHYDVFLFAESVVERIEQPSSGPELAGGSVAILVPPHLTVSDTCS